MPEPEPVPEPEPEPEELPARRRLRDTRPEWLRSASTEMYTAQSTAGEGLAYGAVGDSDYTIEGGAGVERRRVWSVIDEVETMLRRRRRRQGSRLRMLDIGTGDGKLLLALHQRCGLPWEDIVGVTAEDMRGVRTRTDKEPFDLRETGGAESEASYIVWNAESLDRCPALTGRKFDMVVSWMTFCWLSDPLGTLELAHDSFLAPGGLLVVGGVQMLTRQAEVIEDQRFLSSLRDRLRAEGRRVDVFADAGQPWHSWVLLRKGGGDGDGHGGDCTSGDGGDATGAPQQQDVHELALGRWLSYDEREEGGNKCTYAITLPMGVELEPFRTPDELTVMPMA